MHKTLPISEIDKKPPCKEQVVHTYCRHEGHGEKKRTKHGATNKSYFPSEWLNIGRWCDEEAHLLFLIPSHLAQKARWLKSDSGAPICLSQAEREACAVLALVGDMAAQIKVDSHQSLFTQRKSASLSFSLLWYVMRRGICQGEASRPTPLYRTPLALPFQASIWAALRFLFSLQTAWTATFFTSHHANHFYFREIETWGRSRFQMMSAKVWHGGPIDFC